MVPTADAAITFQIAVVLTLEARLTPDLTVEEVAIAAAA